MQEPDTLRGQDGRNEGGDPDDLKGAVEGDRPSDSPQQGNRNLPALDPEGRPSDRKKIGEDVIGANEDESVG